MNAVRIAALLLLMPRATALAEEPAGPLQPGARVRLTLACDPGPPSAAGEPGRVCQHEGRFVGMRDGALTLSGAESTQSHRLNAAARVQVSRGTRSRWLAGAGAGFVVGAGATFVLLNRGGSTNPCDSTKNQDAMGTGACVGIAALGGVAGAGLGALVGSLVRSERWQDVPVERLRVSVGAQPGAGFGVGVALAF